MPEENWAAHGGIAACDLCHSRKVKCDRQEPCQNCVTAQAQCLRTRQRSKPPPRLRTDDKIKALVEKIATLEETVIQKTSLTRPYEPTSRSKKGHTDGTDIARPSKRQRNEASVNAPSDSAKSQVPLSTCTVAREQITKELSDNATLAVYQRAVLETAVAFIDQLSQASTTNTEDNIYKEKVPTDFTEAELVHIILTSQQQDMASLSTQLHLLDHIPPQSLERIATLLLEKEVDSRTLNMCKVVVHFKAALSLYASQLQAPQKPMLRERIKGMQLRHFNAAMTALENMSFLLPPSLLLLQALLTGAILMYIAGNPSSCWTFTAYASQTLVALGYHTLREPIAQSDEDVEIHAAMAWCYHFDRVMSLLLCRPLSLPPIQFPIASLVPHNPGNSMAIFATVMLELVPVHERILELSLITHRERASRPEASLNEELTYLRSKMDEIYEMMEQTRASNPVANADYELHWVCLEFKYFSTLTAVHRLGPSVCRDVAERNKCLHSARRALQCVKGIQNLAKQQDHFVEDFHPYLAWTILSYPLAPFFVLFCNVVGTSDLGDLQLMQDVVDSVSSLMTENKFVERLQRLCNALLSLCRPLVQHQALPTPLVEPAEAASSKMPSSGLTTSELQSSDAMATSSWDDNLMLQLFHCQPSLEWYNAEILDAQSWDFTNLPTQ